MKIIPPFVFVLGFMLCANWSFAQTPASVMNYYAAEWYDRFEGPTRLAEVQKLQKNNWITIDTFYDLTQDQPGKKAMHTVQNSLEPYLDEEGLVVYWVPEIAPQFPGGKKALELFTQDVLGLKAARQGESVQQSVYIRFVIDTDGSVKSVASAQSNLAQTPADIISNCLDAVRYMPAWSPGRHRGQPVRVCRMMTFPLKE